MCVQLIAILTHSELSFLVFKTFSFRSVPFSIQDSLLYFYIILFVIKKASPDGDTEAQKQRWLVANFLSILYFFNFYYWAPINGIQKNWRPYFMYHFPMQSALFFSALIYDYKWVTGFSFYVKINPAINVYTSKTCSSNKANAFIIFFIQRENYIITAEIKFLEQVFYFTNTLANYERYITVLNKESKQSN